VWDEGSAAVHGSTFMPMILAVNLHERASRLRLDPPAIDAYPSASRISTAHTVNRDSEPPSAATRHPRR